jgi:hypothetical protein
MLEQVVIGKNLLVPDAIQLAARKASHSSAYSIVSLAVTKRSQKRERTSNELDEDTPADAWQPLVKRFRYTKLSDNSNNSDMEDWEAVQSNHDMHDDEDEPEDGEDAGPYHLSVHATADVHPSVEVRALPPEYEVDWVQSLFKSSHHHITSSCGVR